MRDIAPDVAGLFARFKLGAHQVHHANRHPLTELAASPTVDAEKLLQHDPKRSKVAYT